MSDLSTPSPEPNDGLPLSGLPPELNLAPPPPLAELTPEQQARAGRAKVRVWSTFIFAICALMLGIGLWLKPDSRGLETHRQLGLLPCGFYRATGIPCPTCGCTTAVSHFAHGEMAASLYTQPFGFVVGLLATLLVPVTAVGMVTGRWMGPSLFWISWHWRGWVYGGVLVLLASWLYKIWLVKVGLSG